MKRIFLFFMLAVAMATVATAQPKRVEGLSSTQRLLGYTLTDDINESAAAFGAAGTYTIGAALEPSAIAPYKGCRLVGIRIGAAMNLGRTRTFLYNFTGTEFALLSEQKQRLYEGWNNVFFNGDGIEIQGDETFFFGYDYVETQEMVDSEEGGIACVGTDTEGSFYLYGNYGQGEGLYSISGAGKLCVQLIVDVSSLPRNDMSLISVDGGFKYKNPGEKVEVMVTLDATGLDKVESYQLGYQLDDEAPQLFTPRDTILAPGSMDIFIGKINLPDDIAVGHHNLGVFVSSVNGEPIDQSGYSKRIDTGFAVYAESVERNMVYLEVYTDQASPYSVMLNDVMAMVEKSSPRLCVVNVHRPGTPLANTDAAYLTDLYAYTYPSFTVNRAYFPGEAYVAYDMNDYLPVMETWFNAAILQDIAMQDLNSPSFATLSLKGTFQPDTRKLTIEATGELLPEAKAIYGDVALTLMLTEDSVVSRQAVYNAVTQRTSYVQGYKHNHVLRGYMTENTGDVVEADDEGIFRATFTTTLNKAWNADLLKVVGLLTKATDNVVSEPLADLDVINATCVNVGSMEEVQGVSSPERAVSSASHSSYLLDGRAVKGHHRGIIVRDGRKVVVK